MVVLKVDKPTQGEKKLTDAYLLAKKSLYSEFVKDVKIRDKIDSDLRVVESEIRAENKRLKNAGESPSKAHVAKEKKYKDTYAKILKKEGERSSKYYIGTSDLDDAYKKDLKALWGKGGGVKKPLKSPSTLKGKNNIKKK